MKNERKTTAKEMKANIKIKIKSQAEDSDEVFDKTIVAYFDPNEIAWMHQSPEDIDCTVIQMKAGPQYLSEDSLTKVSQAWTRSRRDWIKEAKA